MIRDDNYTINVLAKFRPFPFTPAGVRLFLRLFFALPWYLILTNPYVRWEAIKLLYHKGLPLLGTRFEIK